MPVGGEQTLSGPYTVTYNSVALGIFQGEEGVPSIVRVPKSRPVAPTDKYGQAKIDSVILGDDYMFEGVLEEYQKALTVLNRFSAWGRQPLIGDFKFNYAVPLVLTAVAGTPAAVAAAPATLTASKAVPSDDFPTRIQFGPMLRVVPIRLDFLPYLSGQNVVNFIET